MCGGGTLTDVGGYLCYLQKHFKKCRDRFGSMSVYVTVRVRRA